MELLRAVAWAQHNQHVRRDSHFARILARASSRETESETSPIEEDRDAHAQVHIAELHEETLEEDAPHAVQDEGDDESSDEGTDCTSAGEAEAAEDQESAEGSGLESNR